MDNARQGSAEPTTNERQKMGINLDELTIKQAREIAAMFSGAAEKPAQHPMIGRRCVIRTYSAGVHIGKVAEVTNGMEVHLTDSIRLWRWEGGGLSLSAVANNGIKGGRVNRTGEIYLTNAIEIIPTTEDAEESYARFIED